MLETIDIGDVVAIARKAGCSIMEIYERHFSVTYKEDSSPLTEADIAAHAIICRSLQKQYPDIPILSEEGRAIPYETRREWEYFWLIDPIDGTKEFIKKNGEFTVNIALIHNCEPVLGVVYAPAIGDIYYAKRGEGAFKNGDRLPLRYNDAPQSNLRVAISSSHFSKETRIFIDRVAKTTEALELISKGSSLKLCMVAEGEADIYPRMSPTTEWDTAAADAIVRESGKMTYQYHSAFNMQHPTSEDPLVYNKEDLLNPWFVVR